MNRVLVSDIMTRQLIGVEPDTNLLECARKLIKKKVGSLLILEGYLLKGFISTQDILWAIVKKPNCDLSKIKAIDISPKKIITIKPEASLEDAIRKIKKFKFHKIPVVKNKEVVGLIALRDIVNFYPEINREFSEVEEIKEETEKMKRVEDSRDRIIMRDGICEECGERGPLYRVNGILVCSSCVSNF